MLTFLIHKTTNAKNKHERVEWGTHLVSHNSTFDHIHKRVQIHNQFTKITKQTKRRKQRTSKNNTLKPNKQNQLYATRDSFISHNSFEIQNTQTLKHKNSDQWKMSPNRPFFPKLNISHTKLNYIPIFYYTYYYLNYTTNRITSIRQHVIISL